MKSDRKENREVSNFIRTNFHSVWALELLCLLLRHRDRALGHAEMVAELRGSDLAIAQSVESLEAVGLVLAQADGGARYGPVSPALDEMAGKAAALYATRPDAVRRTIAKGAEAAAASAGA
jgi:hypothetical protein